MTDVHSVGAGLDPTSLLALDLSTNDTTGDLIVLMDYTAAPTDVLRDSVSTTAWSYDAVADELTLMETDGALHTWEVIP